MMADLISCCQGQDHLDHHYSEGKLSTSVLSWCPDAQASTVFLRSLISWMKPQVYKVKKKTTSRTIAFNAKNEP